MRSKEHLCWLSSNLLSLLLAVLHLSLQSCNVRKLLAFPLHPPNRKALHAVSRLFLYIRLLIKVRRSQNSFSSRRFLQKTNERILLYYYETSGRLVFIHFLEEIENTKRHFGIIWPLVLAYFSPPKTYAIFVFPKKVA